MKTWKNRAQKLLIIHNWMFLGSFLELPIWPKIAFPYLKLGWGTLCPFYYVVWILQTQTFVRLFFQFNDLGPY